MISLETHPDLYVKNYSQSLEFAKTLTPFRTGDKMKFHLYCRVPCEVNDKHLTCLKSIVAAHEDLNSDNYEINLWSNVDLTNNEILKPVAPFVKHKIWNPLDEMIGTPLEDHIEYFRSVATDDALCWLGIDLFKILSLYKYGGFYVDMDVFILRDMSPLNDLNFIYQWGDTGANPNAPNPMGGPPSKTMLCNGAVMGLQKESITAFRFLEQLRYISPVPNTVCWGCALYAKITDPDLYKLPCAWFNIELLDNMPAGFNHLKYHPYQYDPHEGCFAWHWHSSRRWNETVEVGSKFDKLRTIIDEKFDSVLQHA